MIPLSSNSMSSDTGPVIGRSPLSQYRTVRLSAMRRKSARPVWVRPARRRMALKVAGVTPSEFRCERNAFRLSSGGPS